MNDKKLDRRDFLKGVALTGAAASLGTVMQPALKAFAQNDRGSYELGGEWKPTTCQGCTSWCAKQIYVLNGRAIKVRGNPNSKVNGSASCPRAHLSLQEVYDPDRVKVPMKRTNPKKGINEDPGFVPISWDEALNTVADKIMELRKNNESHKYLLLRGRYSLLTDLIYDRMTKIIGSPNNISHSAICAEAEKVGPFYTEGLWSYRQYDVLNTEYILLWGADPLAANRQVSSYIRNWGQVLDKATVAVIDPRLSLAASKASEWLPIKPGQDGALACAIAHTILVEGLWSREFVGDFNDGTNKFIPGSEVAETEFTENFTSGLVKWWNLELKDKTPEWAAEKTGLPVDQIQRVAIGFGKASPRAISWPGRGPVMQVRGAYASMAAHALNGLVGSVDSKGGTLRPNSATTVSFPSPTSFEDQIALDGLKNSKIDGRGTKAFPAMDAGVSGAGVVTNNTADNIINDTPNEIKVIIAYMNNFAFSCPGTQRWYNALTKVPFSVSITTNASETAWFADIILPAAHHMYEKWGYADAMNNGYRHVTMNQPVIKPVWDVKIDESEIPWLLAEKLASKGFENLLKYYKSIKDPETDKEPTNEKEFAVYAVKRALQPLWDPAQYKSGDKFKNWEDFRSVGVWNSSPYVYRGTWGKMGTKTKKFEFYSDTLKGALDAHAQKHKISIDEVLQTCNYQARGEKAFVPHYEEPYVLGSQTGFLFVDHKSRLNREGRSANTPWYQEMKDHDPGDEAWDDVVKINPIDAKSLGLNNGDHVKISSPAGELDCTVKLWEGTRPGVVVKCYGQGHWAYGRIAAKKFGKTPRGGNNNNVIPAEYERLSGASAFYSVRVQIQKI